jgi:glycosyltransferase involved in cell wall biosynthesis
MEIRARAQLHALETLAKVDLLWLGARSAIEGSDYYRKRHIPAVLPWAAGPKREPLRSLVRLLGSRGTSLIGYVPGYHRFFAAPAEPLRAVGEIVRSGYDLLYFVTLETYWYLGMPLPERTVVDLNDVHSLLAEAAWRSETSPGKRLLKGLKMRNMRREERAVIEMCAASVVCSEADRSRLGMDRVEVFPNGYPDYGQGAEQTEAGDSNALLFVGTLKYAPNRDAVRFFSCEVLPRIRQEIPGAELVVAGELPAGERDWLPQCAGVRLLGRVEDLAPLIRGAALEVAPLLKGLGTRIKILEALSFGKPVVSTGIGAYGIEMGLEEGLFRVDDPAEMAAACVRLMRSPAQRLRLGAIGRERVAQLYGQEALNKRMAQIVDRAMPTATPASG